MSATEPRDRPRPTIRDVAARAGVSYQTVSNVLNHPQRVSQALSRRVLAAVDELGFRPSATARSLVLGASKLVAFRVGDGRRNEASVLDPFMRELARIGSEHGYRLVLDYAPSDDEAQIRSYAEMYGRHLVDAVVVAETHPGDQRPAWLAEHGVPVVAFGRPWGDPAATHAWVDVDMRLGLELAVRHLADRGHRRIGFVGGAPDGARNDERRAGWLAAMAQCAPEVDTEPLAALGAYREVAGDIGRLIEDQHVTAVVCHDDGYADDVSHVARNLGLVPGADLALVGFDDSDIARRAQPALSSVAQPITAVAELVWRALLAQLAGSGEGPIQQIVSPELVVRASSDWRLGEPEAAS